MNHLLLNALLLLMLPSPDRSLPAEFFQLPEHIREQATIVFSGTFSRARTPCFYRNGMRVWFLDSFFAVRKVHRGVVGNKYISINPAMLPKTEYANGKLVQGHRYLVLLQPDRAKMEKIRTKDGISFWDALYDREILAIIELK